MLMIFVIYLPPVNCQFYNLKKGHEDDPDAY